MTENFDMTENRQESLAREWYDRKSAMMADMLGPEHDQVMHSPIPYSVGGGLDLYYFRSRNSGTAIATKELSEVPGQGPSNDLFDNYELVMFTRHALDLHGVSSPETAFGREHRLINAVLNCIARYSAQATLNPNETCEFPEDVKTVGGQCLIFDAYKSDDTSPLFGLLAVVMIHRSEMEYAQKHGGKELITKLKQAGYYPYSDLDRPAVA